MPVTNAVEMPILLTKKQVAELFQCSQRQIELMTSQGRLPKAVYLAQRSPRWKRAELLACIEQAGGVVRGKRRLKRIV